MDWISRVTSMKLIAIEFNDPLSATPFLLLCFAKEWSRLQIIPVHAGNREGTKINRILEGGEFSERGVTILFDKTSTEIREVRLWKEFLDCQGTG